MSVAEHFRLDDAESSLLDQARVGWRGWCNRDPDLAVVEDLLDLRDWTRQAARGTRDTVLAKLAAIARDDGAARSALVWLLIPGATVLAARLSDLSPEIDGLVAGQLWIEVARSHQLGPYGIAQAILNETRRQVTAELGVGTQARLRDKVWAEVRLVDHFDERVALVEPPSEDPARELLEFLDIALRDHAIEAFDAWLLHELATEATALAAPLRRGRCGLASPAVIQRVASKRPESARTLRRRVARVLDNLAAYSLASTDEARLGRWRDAHPKRILTWREWVRDEAEIDATFGQARA